MNLIWIYSGQTLFEVCNKTPLWSFTPKHPSSIFQGRLETKPPNSEQNKPEPNQKNEAAVGKHSLEKQNRLIFHTPPVCYPSHPQTLVMNINSKSHQGTENESWCRNRNAVVEQQVLGDGPCRGQTEAGAKHKAICETAECKPRWSFQRRCEGRRGWVQRFPAFHTERFLGTLRQVFSEHPKDLPKNLRASNTQAGGSPPAGPEPSELTTHRQ